MKKLILLAFTSVLAMSADFATFNNVDTANENKRLCKVFIEKAHTYQDTMRSDELAKATLDSYKDRVVTYCGAVSAKQPMNPFAANIVLKNVEAKINNVELCKISIKTAQKYKDTQNKDQATLDSYKNDVVANCGTISAKV
jgi:RNA-binding protein YhbY